MEYYGEVFLQCLEKRPYGAKSVQNWKWMNPDWGLEHHLVVPAKTAYKAENGFRDYLVIPQSPPG